MDKFGNATITSGQGFFGEFWATAVWGKGPSKTVSVTADSLDEALAKVRKAYTDRTEPELTPVGRFGSIRVHVLEAYTDGSVLIEACDLPNKPKGKMPLKAIRLRKGVVETQEKHEKSTPSA